MRTFGGGGIHDVGILKGKSLTIMLVFRVTRTHALSSMLGRDTDSDRANSFLILNISVTLHCANGLIACDSFGKSDPYCYVDLGNQRFRSRTIYKTVNPGMTSEKHI